jgi:hypothetical protein
MWLLMWSKDLSVRSARLSKFSRISFDMKFAYWTFSEDRCFNFTSQLKFVSTQSQPVMQHVADFGFGYGMANTATSERFIWTLYLRCVQLPLLKFMVYLMVFALTHFNKPVANRFGTGRFSFVNCVKQLRWIRTRQNTWCIGLSRKRTP